AMQSSAFAKLEAVQELKKNQVEELFQGQRQRLQALKSDPYAQTAMFRFIQDFDEEEKIGTSTWNRLAAKYQIRFEELMNQYGWYDIFIIHPNGDILYSVTRESDLGMNLADSELKDSALGRAYAEAVDMDAESLAVGDFAPYAPSNGAFAAFMMAKIEGDMDETQGFFAFQLPTAPINAIVQQRAGMGQTMETYLVGELDGETAYRSDRVVKKGNKIGKKKGGSNIKAALSGKSGIRIKTGSSGAVEVVAYAPLDIPGLNWVSITSGSLEEVLAAKAEGEEKDFFTKYIEKYGYYDLFLIHPKGRVFYSVSKEADYETNMVGGKYKDSGLGQLTRKVLETKQYGVADFAPYAPSNGDPAAFIAQPYLRDGEVELIVALQLSLEAINTVMQQRDGMGETGETYLVGSDKLMRSDSFLDPQGHSIKASFAGTVEGNGVDTEAASEALAGKTDSKIITDYNGNP
ncbi:MAG: methyl-accepting chemotaxis protein, partial [Gammaproteobacteria bacterium]|nr:methyl-accepting chemotaxis protein [Gammaproteobacteria bacterium]